MKTKKVLFGIIIGLVFILSTAILLKERIVSQFFKPTSTVIDRGITTFDLEQKPQDDIEAVEVIAEGLDIPWAVGFLPEGDLLVTERPGTLKRVGKNKQTFEIAGVAHLGEGGLMGLAVHPDFESNQKIYLYLTTDSRDGLLNRVVQYRLENDQLTGRKLLLDNIPGAKFHDGGRIAFGPDGKLYVTTGDAGNSTLAQDKSSLAGKILRMNDDGSIPSDNPFNNYVYSFGHRNPQGIAWDDSGNLWSTEHGPSGTGTGFDEVNLIEKGKNYGWPTIRGSQKAEGMVTPVRQSGAGETWAPAGVAFVDGSLYFAGLRGQSIYQAVLDGTDISKLKVHFRQDYGRLREIILGPDGLLYVTTSNTDGRGKPEGGDDKIILINPAVFK